MALQIDTTVQKEPVPPTSYARAACRFAWQWVGGRRSREILESRTQAEIGNPMHQKLAQTSSRTMLLYLTLTIAYGLTVYWEWTISREIYEVLIPTTAPGVPFAGCVLIALYASACLGECTTQFALFSLENGEAAGARHDAEANRAVRNLYDLSGERRTATNWFLNPVTGVIVTGVFLAGIYYASLMRVKLQQEAGELPDADLQIYLPVILYGVEIVLGIPAFFCAMWMHNLLSMRKRRSELTQARLQESTVLDAAVANWTLYMSERETYNQYARSQGKPEAEAMPPSRDLHDALEMYFGVGLIEEGTGANGRAERPVSPSSPENGGSPGSDGNSEREGNRREREEELLNLLDEQIARQNRGL